MNILFFKEFFQCKMIIIGLIIISTFNFILHHKTSEYALNLKQPIPPGVN